jgi:hypothetical protein
MYCSHTLTPIDNTFRLSAPYCCGCILSLSYNMSYFCVTQALMKIIDTCNEIKSFSLCFRFILLLNTVREKSIDFKLIRTNAALVIRNINILSIWWVETIVYLVSINIMYSITLTYFKFLAGGVNHFRIIFSFDIRLNTSCRLKEWLINWLSYFIFFNTLFIFQVIEQLFWYSRSIVSILKLNKCAIWTNSSAVTIYLAW